MKLVLNDEQKMLQETVKGLVNREAGLDRIRDLADTETAYSRTLWSRFAEMGWTGIPFPDDSGGLGMGYADLAVVTEQLGASLAPEPLLSTLWSCGQVLLSTREHASDESLAAAWIPKVVNGDTILALAWQEAGSRYSRTHVETEAAKKEGEWRLDGQKVQVMDAVGSDGLIVSARTSGETEDTAGLSLFLVQPNAEGVSVEAQHRIDGRNAALVTLESAAGQLLGEEGAGGRALLAGIEAATVGICAEMVGAMQAAFDMTLAYLKEREQFGVKIGSFQALKHRAAYLFSDLQIARATAMAAARALDEYGPEHFMTWGAVSLAKATCSETFMKIANEGVQMHGGIGMTEEHDIGLFLKRARVCEFSFGDAAYHRNRWAKLNAY